MSSDPTEIEIVGYREELAPDFARLNYEWIEKAYTIEDHDRELLSDPHTHIIEPGGEILFAMSGENVAGTVALIPFGSDSFELAKMAVSPESRGRGIGDRLMAASIDQARKAGKRSIILESNTRQVAAIALYRKHGFEETPLDPNSHFTRANIRMELRLDQ